MKYLCLIYSDETAEQAPEAMQAIMGEYMALEQELAGQPGFKLGGEALDPTNTAKTVRIRSGETSITDGPFAETKEQLGGFYLIEAADLDEALKFAARIPTAKNGSVEVRPVMKIDF